MSTDMDSAAMTVLDIKRFSIVVCLVRALKSVRICVYPWFSTVCLRLSDWAAHRYAAAES
jgi:hypothetical protein